MKKILLFLVTALLAVSPFVASAPVVAAKPAPSGTIALARSSDLHFGQIVTFDVTVSSLNKNQNPRIQLLCSQNGVVVYGEAHNVDARYGPAPWDGPSFQLGGGSSPWTEAGGGPADCEATLYYWDFHPSQTFVPLAEPLLFSVEG